MRFHFSKLTLPVFKAYQHLHPTIIETLANKGLHTATPVQDLYFTSEYRNRLIIGPTGTGKTLAYLLPILSALKKQEEQQNAKLTQPLKIRSLIIVPTKELVDQVNEVAKEYTKPLKLSCTGLGSSQFKLESALLRDKGVDLAITTIDRLQNHREKQNIHLSNVSHFVVDEIDTLLDAGNDQKLTYLNEYFLKRSDSYITFCGATHSNRVKQFVSQLFGDNMKILIEKNVHMHLENLSHEFIHCTTLDKSEPLLALLKSLKSKSILIFTNSISSCHFLEFLFKNQGLKAVTLHSDLPKPLRAQNVTDFRSQRVNVLISTDLGARGLDFPFLDAVINFDFPDSTSDYLHRAGRAGRAGRKGIIYSLYHNKEQDVINELRDANEGDRTINIGESAYSRINRESTTKREPKKEIVKQRSFQKRKSHVDGYKPLSKAKKQDRTKKKSYFTKQYEKR